ncbi:hypothetical protein FF125_06265 [Aureibaculum algae]|uniref:DUF6896 domain-containing protein n=1 Tax=Aureibaculum algae TaxID=2584122 RepID=A0A5B7TPB0_9FLAO|nr:hypothetical protein [Aureibaculum algae]QCX38050.1 hypothetical protein FF125_06265 [Aureibaculum algae]
MIKKWIENLLRPSKKINLEIVKKAIFDYRNEGKELMFKLGEKFNLDIESSEDYERLIARNNENIPRRGELSKKWNYNFHGLECGFYNKKLQQRVEVVLKNPPEFGHIDSWFLLGYMESTGKYKKEVEGVNWQKLKLAVEELYEIGEVVKVAE